MLIQFNTFKKHSADSKLSIDIYLMSVAVTLVSIETKLHGSTYFAVRHRLHLDIQI